jgi:ComF family protein
VSFRELLSAIGDIIFPPQCLACAEIMDPQARSVFCSSCLTKIRFISGSICPVCGIAFFDSPAENHICGNCLTATPHFTEARAVASFETVIMDTIHKFKYGRNIVIGDGLGSFMAGYPFPDFDFSEYSMIIPVPLHIKKLRERRFNQSLLLARALGKKHKIPVNFSLLKRHKFTLTQTGFNKDEREKNIKRAFTITDEEKIAGKNIILVDDVYTTGATVNECSKILKKGGAKDIAVLTLARVI